MDKSSLPTGAVCLPELVQLRPCPPHITGKSLKLKQVRATKKKERYENKASQEGTLLG